MWKNKLCILLTGMMVINGFNPICAKNVQVIHKQEETEDKKDKEYNGYEKSELHEDEITEGNVWLTLTIKNPSSFDRERSDMTNYVKTVYNFYNDKYNLEQYLVDPSQGIYLGWIEAVDEHGNPIWDVFTDEDTGETKLSVFDEDYMIISQTKFTYPKAGETVNDSNDGKTTEEILEAKFDSADAWYWLIEYGKREYPYGFKVHNIMGKIAEEAKDENTWFLKAEVTVTNAFGAKRETVVEAEISGTLDNPNIEYFYVYD